MSKKSKKASKTLTMRVLEGQGVPYIVIEFPESVHDAIGVAKYAGLPQENVYKTLVVRADDPGFKPMLVMILRRWPRSQARRKSAWLARPMPNV